MQVVDTGAPYAISITHHRRNAASSPSIPVIALLSVPILAAAPVGLDLAALPIVVGDSETDEDPELAVCEEEIVSDEAELSVLCAVDESLVGVGVAIVAI
jgi:hypothetical protein